MKFFACMRYFIDEDNVERLGLIDGIYSTFESAVKRLENQGYSEIDDADYKTEVNCVWRSKVKSYKHLDGGYFCTVEPVFIDDSQ